MPPLSHARNRTTTAALAVRGGCPLWPVKSVRVPGTSYIQKAHPRCISSGGDVAMALRAACSRVVNTGSHTHRSARYFLRLNIFHWRADLFVSVYFFFVSVLFLLGLEKLLRCVARCRVLMCHSLRRHTWGTPVRHYCFQSLRVSARGLAVHFDIRHLSTSIYPSPI